MAEPGQSMKSGQFPPRRGTSAQSGERMTTAEAQGKTEFMGLGAEEDQDEEAAIGAFLALGSEGFSSNGYLNDDGDLNEHITIRIHQHIATRITQHIAKRAPSIFQLESLNKLQPKPTNAPAAAARLKTAHCNISREVTIPQTILLKQ
ncbi:MAG: hypothetical protein Q9221_006809 [Calogaya cf. arnoldii]